MLFMLLASSIQTTEQNFLVIISFPLIHSNDNLSNVKLYLSDSRHPSCSCHFFFFTRGLLLHRIQHLIKSYIVPIESIVP